MQAGELGHATLLVVGLFFFFFPDPTALLPIFPSNLLSNHLTQDHLSQ